MSLTQRELTTRQSTGNSSRTEVIAIDDKTEILFKDEVVKENEILKEQLIEQKAMTKVAERIYNFKVRPDDIWIITYPKCGTTWMQVVVFYREGGRILEFFCR